MKAQSEVIGLVLLLGITITAIGIILLFGQPAIADASGNAQFDRMENEFSLLDARMSTSVLGASEGQSVSLNVEGGRLTSNPDASWMSVVYENATGSTSEIANITMGNVRYVQGDRTIAYEGGGVWKSNLGNNFTEMVSTPEFHYRGSTLTLPAYNITNRRGISGSTSSDSLFLTSTGEPKLEFPDKNIDNPLEEGNVTVTVKSEYYRGWASYFRSRTTGEIKSVDDTEQKVTFSLSVPTELKLTAGVMYDSSVREKGGGPGGSSSYTGSKEQIEVNLPSADGLVDPKIAKCIPGGGPKCEKLSNLSDGDALDENTIYYKDTGGSDYDFDTNVHAPNSNVTIVVDLDGSGTMTYKNDFAVGDASADPVEVYVDGNIDARGGANINTASVSVGGTTGTGKASSFVTYATGEAAGGANGFGGANYTGVIYAPSTNHGSPACSGSSQKIAGNANIKGTIIGDSVCLAGASSVNFDDSLNLLDLSTDVDLIRYLHITENKIRLTD